MRIAPIVACLFPIAAAANPTGGTVTSGSATISTAGSTVTVNASTTGTIINWNSFSIGAGETTRVNQPSAASVSLNRVTGPSSSSINGSLQSNGQVFLVNPNGIVFGSTASVNVAGFVASTLVISDADFLSGNLRFTASGSAGSITGAVNISADSYAALIAPTINISGNVSAGPGGIALAAGDPVQLTMSAGAFTSVNAGSNIPGATIMVDGVLSSTGPVFLQTGGGSSLPHALPPVVLPIVPPTLLTITPGSGGGTINWSTFNIGSNSSVALTNPGTATVGALASNTATGSGTVTIQGTLTAAGPAPAVTTAGVALNLEKREVGF
jgi:filamentous hemagglutinin family protein